MTKFFVDRIIPDGETIVTISGNDKHHMCSVLRMKPGDPVETADITGTSFDCELSGYDANNAYLKIISKSDISREPGYRILLYQGLPKSDKLEQIIQKATELGVSEVIPIICARSVPKFRDAKDMTRKTERWQKIASEASGQSGRDIIPVVRKPVSFKEAVAEAAMAEISFLPWECEKQTDLRSFLHNKRGPDKPASVAFMIGPEGGFDSVEIDLAVENGITPVTLGKRILRTETAGPAVLSILAYEFESKHD